MAFYPFTRQHSFDVKSIATLINESVGGREYEDKLKRYWSYESVEKIIEESKENFQANGYTEEEMKHILPLLFHLSAT
jgi:predicted RND superfamily exporter protein